MKIEVLDLSSQLDSHYLEISALAQDCESICNQAEDALERLRNAVTEDEAATEALVIATLAADAKLLSEVALLELNAAQELASPEKASVPELVEWVKLCRTKEAYADTVQAQIRCFRVMAEATLALAEREDIAERMASINLPT